MRSLRRPKRLRLSINDNPLDHSLIFQKALVHLLINDPIAYESFLVYLTGSRVKEAANRLNIPVTTYRQRVERARVLVGDYLNLYDQPIPYEGRQVLQRVAFEIERRFSSS